MNIKELTEGRDQIAYLRDENRLLLRQIKQLRKRLGEQKEFYQQLSAAVRACDPPPRIPWKSGRKSGKPVVAVLKLSDWQIGEVISAAETAGFGRFNWEIAQQRVAFILDAFLRWIETQRHGYRIDECTLLCEGDWISGDIHRELSVTNEFPVPVQAANAGKLLGDAIMRVSQHFTRVHVSSVGADNHGRLTARPQFKQKATNNLSYIVETIAAAYVARLKNVKFERAQGIQALVEVNGKRFLSMHGDTVRGWMGIPYYGLERLRGREASRRMQQAGFDYISLGHFHVPSWTSGNLLINGSLTGTTEFDHAVGRHAAPSQVAFLVHPIHGVFNFTPFAAE